MKPYRSMLFVPGHKPSWAEKAVAAGADATILDLEDSVPAVDKADARKTVRETIGRLRGLGTRANGSANSYDSGLFGADVEEVIVPGLAGLFAQGVHRRGDRPDQRSRLARRGPRRSPPGSVGLIISFETAVSVAHCEEIACASPRVSSLLGATGPNADVGRELGFEFTLEGLETLYQRSRIIVAARAAGLHHPVTGVWQDIKDLDGFRRFAEDARHLGFRGMVCIHPSHVAISNEVFTPSAETVESCRA